MFHCFVCFVAFSTYLIIYYPYVISMSIYWTMWLFVPRFSLDSCQQNVTSIMLGDAKAILLFWQPVALFLLPAWHFRILRFKSVALSSVLVQEELCGTLDVQDYLCFYSVYFHCDLLFAPVAPRLNLSQQLEQGSSHTRVKTLTLVYWELLIMIYYPHMLYYTNKYFFELFFLYL